jgi:hypothetical protein
MFVAWEIPGLALFIGLLVKHIGQFKAERFIQTEN